MDQKRIRIKNLSFEIWTHDREFLQSTTHDALSTRPPSSTVNNKRIAYSLGLGVAIVILWEWLDESAKSCNYCEKGNVN
jgi:hypothetical protein